MECTVASNQEYVQSSSFQLFSWLRGIGALVFVLGGVVPLTWFMVTRWFHLKPAMEQAEAFVVPESVLAVEGSPMRDDLAGSESGLGQA
ncbi:MAG TPA: hypothetical protein QF764_06155 [Planctomycetota bacterium]|nr:hypothetical protein [Planctomycetota bacterium]